MLAEIGHNGGQVTALSENFVEAVSVIAKLASDVQSAVTSFHNIPLASTFPPGTNLTEELILAGMNSTDAVVASNASLTLSFFKIVLETVILLYDYVFNCLLHFS